MRRLYAYPERQPSLAPVDPAVTAKQQALTRRIMRPARDPELEEKLATLQVPTLVVFGTLDAMIPSEMGRVYREIMPNCNYVLVYDAGHEAGADRPEAVASLVSDFLERHEAFVVSRQSSVINP